MFVAAALVLRYFGPTSAALYVCGGCAPLLFVPSLTVPAPIEAVVSEVAGASMFMYRSHYQVNSLVTKLLHGPSPWVALPAAIVFGIVFARAYGSVEKIVIANLGRRRATRGAVPA